MAERSLESMVRATVQPSPSFADQSIGRHVHFREKHLIEMIGTRHLAERPDFDPRRPHRHDEAGEAESSLRRWIGPGQEQTKVADPGPRRPDLLTGDLPPIGSCEGPGRNAGQVGPGVGLGEELAPDLLGAHDERKIASPLGVGAVASQDRRRHLQPYREDLGRDAEPCVLPGEGLLGPLGEALPAILLRPRQPRPTSFVRADAAT